MLVDDDIASSYYNETIIKDINAAIQVESKKSVDEAFDYLLRSDYMTKQGSLLPFPDLIFLDVNMPVMNGWDFIGHYKTMKHFFSKKPDV